MVIFTYYQKLVNIGRGLYAKKPNKLILNRIEAAASIENKFLLVFYKYKNCGLY